MVYFTTTARSAPGSVDTSNQLVCDSGSFKTAIIGKVRRWIAVVFATALVAACGGEGDSGTAAPVTGPTASSGPVWSNPASWPSGKVPQAGEVVTITSTMNIELDVNTPKLGGLIIDGKLTAKPNADVSITSNYVMVHGSNGELRAGSASDPYAGQFNIILSGTDPSQDVMGHGTKMLGTMMGGKVALYGKPKKSFVRLASTIEVGATTIALDAAPTGWLVGDEIAIAPSDYDALESEKRKITAIDGQNVTVDKPFAFRHWGAAAERHGNVSLDMRAHVANLDRNIVVTSIENEERQLPGFDPDSIGPDGQQNGRGKRIGPGRFGGHTVFMEGTSAQLSNVEFSQLGQQGVLARYPVHWHLNKDTSTENNFIKNSVVRETFQRGIVLHQANGIEVEDNVLFDIPGHGIYLEDGIEHDNVIDRNLVMMIRYVPRRHRLSLKDTEQDRAEKLSGFWITNPANLIRDNVVAGVQNGWGFIFANVREDKLPVIDPKDVNWVDNRSFTGFSGNIAYSIGFMQTVPDGGLSVFNLGYGPEEAGSCFRFNFAGDFKNSKQASNLTAFKCANAAFWSTNFLPIKNTAIADSRVAIVNNQGEGGKSELQDSAIVGISANNRSGRTNLTFGPFPGPVLKESLEAGPVTLDNVVVSGAFEETLDGMAPALSATRSATAGYRLILPPFMTLPANGTVSFDVRIDRQGGYNGPIELSVAIPKPSNLAEENPYYYVTSDPVTVPAGATTARMTLRNRAADRPGSGVIVIKSTGDATILNTATVLTSVAPRTYINAAHGNNLSRLIAGDTPRNPALSNVLFNAGGKFAIDGNLTTYARIGNAPAPTVALDFGRNYTAVRLVIEWEPGFAPSGDLMLTVSEFDLLNRMPTLQDATALAPAMVTNMTIRNNGTNRYVLALPAGTTLQTAKLWALSPQTNELRLREIEFISQ
jgi:G8 domain/Right handed beta helix region